MEKRDNPWVLLYMFVVQSLAGLTLLPFFAIFGFLYAIPISFAFDGFPFERFADAGPTKVILGLVIFFAIYAYPFWMSRFMLGGWFLYKSSKYKLAMLLSSIPVAIPIGLIILVGVINKATN